MTADPGTRDGVLAEGIGAAEDIVAELARQLGALVEHARSNDATGHAALYEVVQGHLTGAEKDLRRAYEVMLNGDPEDYAEEVAT